MAGSFETQAGPTYISSRYADNILSDVRPIKLKLEALRSINVLLDEFLYKILGAAGSLSTDSLKTGLHKILPTALGKEAVLEAEVELKEYWDRNTPHTPSKQDFDLYWSFELLRLKCEGYTTMNDTDEDADAIKRVNEKMGVAGSLAPPHTSLLAPASLYITAILEHVCQHILSNVSRVTARDSSRTVATVHDLFVALCEDESMYNTFKSMKVYEQIDSLSTMQHPRRSKSLSKSSMNGRASPALRTASPHADSRESSVTPLSRLRVSSESPQPSVATSLPQQPVSNGRGSSEKSRVKLFGRSSSDHERSEIPDLRQQSDDAKNSNSFELMDEAAEQEFDELMRSSATMKVSLTPDRLKSMEVYKQEKRRHKAQEDNPIQISPEFKRAERAGSARRVQHVDSILEDEETTPITETVPQPSPLPNPPVQNVIVPRARLASLSTSPMSTPSTPVPARTRSVTISAPLSKKRSNSQIRVPPMPLSAAFSPKRGGANENFPKMQNGRPPRTRKVTRNRESIDLDDIMGPEDDDFGTEPPTPRRRDASKPYISQSARELIDFLDEGPPMELQPPNMMNASMVSLESSKTTKSGRLHRMMSRLTLGGSTEKLNGRNGSASEDSFSIRSRTSRRSPSNASFVSSPPSSYLPTLPPIKPLPTVIVATPPPPLASLTSMSSMSLDFNNTPPRNPSPSSHSPVNHSPVNTASNNSSLSNGSPRTTQPRRVSITRKAVPAWEEENTEQVIIVPPSTPKTEKHRSKASPLDAFPPVPETVNIDGRILPNGHVEVIAEMRARRESRTPSPLEATYRSSLLAQDANRSPSPASPAGSGGSHATPPPPERTPPPPPVADDAPVPETDANTEEDEAETEECLSEETCEVVSVLHVEVSKNQEAEPDPEPTTETTESEVHLKAEVAPPTFTADDAQDLRRLIAVATTADECRLLVDMFMAKSGFPVVPSQEECPTPLEVDTVASEMQDLNDSLERSLVSLLLGEEEYPDIEIPSLSEALEPTPALSVVSS